MKCCQSHQNLVGPPRFWITDRSLSGIESTSRLHMSGRISVHQTSRMISLRLSRLEGRRTDTLFLRMHHTFSNGFKSGLLPGHSRSWIPLSCNQLMTIRLRWHGAPSCMNIVQPEMFMWVVSFSFKMSRYLSPLSVTFGGTNDSALLPWDDRQPHTITDWGCFMLETTYRGLYLWLEGRRILRTLLPNDWIALSSDHNTLLHMSVVQLICRRAKDNRFILIRVVKNGFLAGRNDLKPKSLFKRREISILLTWIPLDASSVEISPVVHSGFWTAIRRIIRSSCLEVFLGRPVRFLSTKDFVDEYFTMALWTAVFEMFKILAMRRWDFPQFLYAMICARNSGVSVFARPIVMKIREKVK